MGIVAVDVTAHNELYEEKRKIKHYIKNEL